MAKKATKPQTKKPQNGAKSRSKKKNSHRLAVTAVLVATLSACALLGLLAYGAKNGLIGTNAEANESIISQSELDRQAAEEAAKKAAEEKAAAEKAAAEKAAKEAEEKAKAEAEAKAAHDALIAAHPELAANITLQLPTGDVVINEDLLKTWMVDNGDGTYTKDEAAWIAHINAYVQDMADSIDSLGKERPFQTTGLGTIMIDGSQYYGWEVNREAELTKLTEEINSGATVTREPEYTSRESAKADDNDGYGQDYCEIDASRQHLWIYKGGQLVFETDVVTGLMDKSHYTPEGSYLLFHKETNATLKGDRLPNGKYTYETPVSYWMPFTDTGIGLHDAYWKSVFGYGQNEWNGSHGCVNLPAEVAETVYNLMTTEMPIIVYYSEGCELREAPPSELDQYIAQQQAAAEQKAAEIAAQEAQAAAEKAAQEQQAQQEAEQKAAEEAARAAAEQAAAEQAAAEAAAQAAAQAAAEQAAAEAAEQAAAQTSSENIEG